MRRLDSGQIHAAERLVCSRLGCLSDPRCLGLDYVIAELNMAAPCSCF